MSLGTEIGRHLGSLRCYAGSLTGSRPAGDELVDQVREAIAARTDFPSDRGARLDLLRAIHTIWSESKTARKPVKSRYDSATDLFRIDAPSPAREALLLTDLLGLSLRNAAYVIGATSAEISAWVAEARIALGIPMVADVLIIEDEPIIAMDIETIVRDLGHNVTGVAVTRREAVRYAIAQRPDLILADIQLADDSSGIDAIRDILAEFQVTVIFITAFPERLLTAERPEPTYLITKPFLRTTVRTAIGRALFDAATRPSPASPPKTPADALKPISQESVTARPSPVNAKVVHGQLRLHDSTPADRGEPVRSIEAVRRMHLKTARRLCDSMAGSNVGPGFNARLQATCRLLSRPLSLERELQLGIEIHGLEGMLGPICERLDDVSAADVSVFIADIIDLLNQSASYRRFIAEARAAERVSEEGRNAAFDLALHLERQPDEKVEPALKQAIAEIRAVARDQPDTLSTFALVRTVGNAFRAIGRFFNERIVKIQSKAASSFDETAGTALGKSLAYLVAAAPVGGLLGLLASLYPSEFAFMTQLLRAARSLF